MTVIGLALLLPGCGGGGAGKTEGPSPSPEVQLEPVKDAQGNIISREETKTSPAAK